MKTIIKGAALIGIGAYLGGKMVIKAIAFGITDSKYSENNIERLVKILYKSNPDAVINSVADEIEKEETCENGKDQ